MSFLTDIEQLARPVFQLPDLEDEDVDGTSSMVISKLTCAEESDAPMLRRKVICLDVDSSSKYSGTKVSRDDIFDGFSGMTGIADCHALENGHIQEHSADEGQASEDGEQTNCVMGEKSDDDEEVDDGSDEECESENEVVLATSVSYLRFLCSASDLLMTQQIGNVHNDANSNCNRGSGEDDEEQKALPNGILKEMTVQDLMKDVDQDKQRRKAEFVLTQSEIWEQLLYVKIKLHAALTAFNQLPRGQLAKDLMKEADEETSKNLKLSQKNALKLLSRLLEAERLLLLSSSFTKPIMTGNGGPKSFTVNVNKFEVADSDDEEIESSEDEKDNKKEDRCSIGAEEDDEFGAVQTQSTNIKSLSKRICENEEKFTKFRESTLLKWDERTKLISSRRSKNASNDFSAFEHENIVTQIEKICADKSRVLKRCRTKRSDVERIGGNVEADEDEEIFDDDDFYQLLLKELIDKKTSTTHDPVAMTRHYIEMQKLKCRRKKKKYVDNRASKDRKIKYLPIPKLVNFCPAKPEMIEWSHESRNELFKSLFS
ncbi:TRAUB domain protein [Necator americanus]|uniref:TRAUB domain protein n=1 Tax=Necator americanus TaxID=51031 RepID=W2THM0_NECAM|nr:TRAUB domain protein [Necator americanus]ETN81293.1 TRAUB domain protein [Necator americanus]